MTDSATGHLEALLEEGRDEAGATTEQRRIDLLAFNMPVDWVAHIVGEGLKAEMEELKRKFQKLQEAVIPPPSPEADEKGEEEENQQDTEALKAALEAKTQLERELRHINERLARTEEVVVQQEKVIRSALFEESGPSRGSENTPSILNEQGTRYRRQWTSDSWVADEMESLGVEKERLRVQRRHLDEERGFLAEMAEKLSFDWAKADLVALGADSDGTPVNSKGVAVGRGSEARSPLKTLSSGNKRSGSSRPSPLPLQARLLETDMLGKGSASNNKKKGGITTSLEDTTSPQVKNDDDSSAAATIAASPSSLQAALGFISPIKGGDENVL